jgi:hypothetical protein
LFFLVSPKITHSSFLAHTLTTRTSPTLLAATRIDDQIYEHFRKEFPDLDVEQFDYEKSKTEKEKEKWRDFANKYTDETVKDWNVATLMRSNALTEFSPENSCIVLRIQFHAIEIARNREGVNERRVIPKDE